MDAAGRARLETFTILFNADGSVIKGVAVRRLDGGQWGTQAGSRRKRMG